MFRVTLVGAGDPLEWEVWAHLEDGDPRTLPESFVLGTGDTPDAAKLAAAEALVDAGQQLLKAGRS
jgi:hypothetical protein